MNALQVLFDGLVLGSLYATVGLALVLIFRTSNVLNLGQGGIATAAGYTAWYFSAQLGLAFPMALLMAVVLGLFVGLVLGGLITFGMPTAPPIEKDMLTLGFSFVLVWLTRQMYGPLPQPSINVVDKSWNIAGTVVSGTGLLVMAICVIELVLVLYVLYRTRMGLAMRALSQDAETATIHGISEPKVSLSSWVLGSILGSVSGVLVAAYISLDYEIMIIIMIVSLAGLILGGFGSVLGAIVGGLALGVLSTGISAYLNPGLKNSIILVVVVALLVVRPAGLVGKIRIRMTEGFEARRMISLPQPFKKTRWTNRALILGGVALLLVAPFFRGKLPITSLSLVVATAIAVLALGTFVGFLGEMSLGHAAFTMAGAYTTAILIQRVPDVPVEVLVMIGGLGAGLIGMVIGWATLRLDGFYFSIATLLLMYVAAEVVFLFPELTGGASGVSAYSTTLLGRVGLGPDLAIYYTVALGFMLVAGFTAWILRGRMGMIWVAIRDAPQAVSAHGMSVSWYKVLALTISAALAGVAGGLIALTISYVGPHDFGLHWLVLALLAMVLGGTGSTVGALIGSALIVLIPELFASTAGQTDLAFGLILMAVLVVAPGGLPESFRRIRSAIGKRRRDNREEVGEQVELVQL